MAVIFMFHVKHEKHTLTFNMKYLQILSVCDMM